MRLRNCLHYKKKKGGEKEIKEKEKREKQDTSQNAGLLLQFVRTVPTLLSHYDKAIRNPNVPKVSLTLMQGQFPNVTRLAFVA